MIAHATMAGFPFELYRAIGDDRYVTPGELPPESGEAGHALWEVYDRHFGRFTGAGLDPGFARFVRADVPFGQARFSAGSPIVVAGAGPGLDAVVADLRGVRARVIVITDPAGAAALQRHALTPDLVIIEREPGGREDAPGVEPLALGQRAALLIDPSAPVAAFERGAGVRRLARDLPSWGVWAATAVAVALRAGSTRLVTLGLDGSADADERARTDALLSTLAVHSGAECLEVGPQSGRAGWWPVSWPNVVPGDAPQHAAVTWHDLGGASLLRAEAERDLLFLAPLLPHAREALALARRARAGETVSSRELCRAIEMLLVWGADPSIRWALQRALGLTFLPRLWRTGVSMATPQRLWRPLVLALHELIEQADRFESRLTTLAHAAPREGSAADHAPLEPRSLERRRPTRAEAERVSVVVPVLGDHPHLEDAVASLAEQTYGEIEILIVHDPAHAARCESLRALPLSNVRVLVHAGALRRRAERRHRSRHRRLRRDPRRRRSLAPAAASRARSPTCARIRTSACWRARPARSTPGGTPDATTTARPTITRRGRRTRSTCACAAGRASTTARLSRGAPLSARSAATSCAPARTPDHDLWLRLVPRVRFAKLPTRLYLRR